MAANKEKKAAVTGALMRHGFGVYQKLNPESDLTSDSTSVLRRWKKRGSMLNMNTGM